MSFLQWESQMGVGDHGARFNTLIWHSFLSPVCYTNNQEFLIFFTIEGSFGEFQDRFSERLRVFICMLRIVVMGPD